jgi:hypothetical protein
MLFGEQNGRRRRKVESNIAIANWLSLTPPNTGIELFGHFGGENVFSAQKLIQKAFPKGLTMTTIDLNPEGYKDRRSVPLRSGGRGVTRDADLDSTLSTDPLLAGVPSWTYVRGVL